MCGNARSSQARRCSFCQRSLGEQTCDSCPSNNVSPKVKDLDKTICIVQEGWIKDDGDVFAGLAKLGAVKPSEEFFLLLLPLAT